MHEELQPTFSAVKNKVPYVTTVFTDRTVLRLLPITIYLVLY